jgi:hypothetical protein
MSRSGSCPGRCRVSPEPTASVPDSRPARLVTVIGYPDNQDGAIFCQNYSRSFSATRLVFRCGGCTAGTSGSPLLARVDAATGLGTVIGVIGGYQQGGVTDAISYAAALGLHIALYQAPITGS